MTRNRTKSWLRGWTAQANKKHGKICLEVAEGTRRFTPMLAKQLKDTAWETDLGEAVIVGLEEGKIKYSQELADCFRQFYQYLFTDEELIQAVIVGAISRLAA